MPIEVVSHFGEHIAILEDILETGDTRGISNLGTLNDGQNVHVVEHAQAVKIE